MRVLAIDLGTTNCKAAIFEHGRLITRRVRALETLRPAPGQAEQDPATWRETVATLIAELGVDAGTVDAIGLSAQSDSLVLTDADGTAVAPAILWMDRRGTEEAAAVAAAIGVEEIHSITGLRPGATFTAPTAAAVRGADPRLFARARWMLQPKDYLFAWLTGEVLTDPSSASRTLVFDPRTDQWVPHLSEAFGIPVKMLPPVAATSSVSRPLSSPAAGALGLRAGIPVAVGAADRAAEALGLGVGASHALLSTGTASAVVVAVPQQVEVLDTRLIAPRHAITGERLLLAGIPTAGVLVEWVGRIGGNRRSSVARLLAEAEGTALGADGVICAVSFAGARSIRWEPDARGAFVGLGLESTRGHLGRAVIEALGWETAAILSVVAQSGHPVEDLVLAGGLHRSDFVCQTMADVTGVPARRPRERDAALAGAMLLGVAALDSTNDLRSAASRRLSGGKWFAPDPSRHEWYRDARGRYESAVAMITGWGS